MDRQMHQFNTSAAMEGAGDDSFDGEIIGGRRRENPPPTTNGPPNRQYRAEKGIN
jgi:hypothetical protein